MRAASQLQAKHNDNIGIAKGQQFSTATDNHVTTLYKIKFTNTKW